MTTWISNRFGTIWQVARGAGPAWLQDAGLLALRLGGAFMLLCVHGLPKVLHYSSELQHIEDPLHLGPGVSLLFAIFAEVLCPVAIAFGVAVRVAALPIVTLLLVAMLLVHPDWSLAEGQFGWLLLTIFGALLIAGGGRFSIDGWSRYG
ncbi:MAG: DoxX family protein [Burkholderiaceae bacterium]|nr:DoxX family protein [Burkholderiaceae bacterium]